MKKRIWLIAVLIVCVALALELYRSNRIPVVEYETVNHPALTEPVRIVHLSDLHNARFGENNRILLDRVRQQAPELIFFTGDLVTAGKKETDVAMALVEELGKIAPVYVSLGNHEQQHENRFGSDLTGMLEARGARVLEYAYADITAAGQDLRIGGVSGYCVPEEYLEIGDGDPEECAFLNKFEDTDRLTLLLCHMPLCWIQNDGISKWDTDLVFSGHVHGGQFRIPFIGGVYAPDMGLFPGVLEGQYLSEDGTKSLILSRGLGNSLPIPRLNNPPQILVVDLLPE